MPFISIDAASAEPAPDLSALAAPLTSVGETLDSLRDELVAMLGNRTDVTPTRATGWVNRAYRDVCSSVTNIPELRSSYDFSTVVSQPFYAIPKELGHIEKVSLGDLDTYPSYGGRELVKTDIGGYRRARLFEGSIERYFRHGSTLVLYPHPDSVVTMVVDFIIRPADLTAPTDSPIIPPEWHEAILLLARAKAHSGLLEFAHAKDALADYNSWVAARVDRDAEERVSPMAQVVLVRKKRQLYRDHNEADNLAT
jgi:hypothetical protein